MPTLKRTRTTFVQSGGGGGGPPTTAALLWGPDFGEGSGSDGNTFAVQAAIDLDNVNLTGNLGVATAIDLDSLAMTGNLGLSAAIDLDSLAMTGNLGAGVGIDLDSLAMVGNLGVNAAITMPALALTGNLGVDAAMTGTALGAPFWQEVNTGIIAPTVGTNSTVTVSKLAGTQVGDLLLAFVGIMGGLLATDWNTPSGWTLVRTDTQTTAGGAATNNAAGIFWRIADSSDIGGAPYSFSATVAGTRLTAEVHRITAFDSSTPIDAHAGATLLASALDPDPNPPSVTTTVVNTRVFAHLLHDHLALNQTHTPPASHVERTDFEADNTTTVTGSTTADRVFAATGATGTVEFNCTETVATDAIIQRVAIAPGTITLA